MPQPQVTKKGGGKQQEHGYGLKKQHIQPDATREHPSHGNRTEASGYGLKSAATRQKPQDGAKSTKQETSGYGLTRQEKADGKQKRAKENSGYGLTTKTKPVSTMETGGYGPARGKGSKPLASSSKKENGGYGLSRGGARVLGSGLPTSTRPLGSFLTAPRRVVEDEEDDDADADAQQPNAAEARTVADFQRELDNAGWVVHEELSGVEETAGGTVFKATRQTDHKTFAVKWLQSTEGVPDPLYVAKRLREGRALKMLPEKSPFLVGFDGIVSNGKDEYIILELCDATLGSWLKDEEKAEASLPRHVLAACMWQMFAGLAQVHDRELCHKDVHPGNLFVVFEGSSFGADVPAVKLGDFGLTEPMGLETNPDIVSASAAFLLAPELHPVVVADELQKCYHTPAQDVWSMAACCALLALKGSTCALVHEWDTLYLEPSRVAEAVLEHQDFFAQQYGGPEVFEFLHAMLLADGGDPKARPTAVQALSLLESSFSVCLPRDALPELTLTHGVGLPNPFDVLIDVALDIAYERAAVQSPQAKAFFEMACVAKADAAHCNRPISETAASRLHATVVMMQLIPLQALVNEAQTAEDGGYWDPAAYARFEAILNRMNQALATAKHDNILNFKAKVQHEEAKGTLIRLNVARRRRTTQQGESASGRAGASPDADAFVKELAHARDVYVRSIALLEELLLSAEEMGRRGEPQLAFQNRRNGSLLYRTAAELQPDDELDRDMTQRVLQSVRASADDIEGTEAMVKSGKRWRDLWALKMEETMLHQMLKDPEQALTSGKELYELAVSKEDWMLQVRSLHARLQVGLSLLSDQKRHVELARDLLHHYKSLYDLSPESLQEQLTHHSFGYTNGKLHLHAVENVLDSALPTNPNVAPQLNACRDLLHFVVSTFA